MIELVATVPPMPITNSTIHHSVRRYCGCLRLKNLRPHFYKAIVRFVKAVIPDDQLPPARVDDRLDASGTQPLPDASQKLFASRAALGEKDEVV